MTTAFERSSFIGKQVPLEVKQLVKYIKKIDIKIFSHLIKVASSMLSSANPNHEQFAALTKNIERDIVEKLYPGILILLQRALRLPVNSLKQQDFVQDLAEINMPSKCVEPLVNALFGESRIDMDNKLMEEKPRFPAVDNLRWRVDVSISTTAFKRTLEPSVLCNIKTNTNEEHTFEMSKEKFHELRYSVAEVLSNMQQLEKRSILKIES